jgi:hypothetical protein
MLIVHLPRSMAALCAAVHLQEQASKPHGRELLACSCK